MTSERDASPLPRWEWRIFERVLPVDPAVLQAEPVRVSDETYLVAPPSRYNVKVRQGQIDIKLLEEVSAEGLERWRPVLKRAFPIDAATLFEVCRALGTPPPRKLLDHYALADLLRDVIAPGRDLVAVQILKRRRRLRVLGCEGELVVLRLRGERWESLGFEDPDPGRVLAAVHQLGLDGRSNTNYPNGLRRILGLSLGSSLPSHGAA